MDAEDTRRRIRAARALADITVEQLAGLLDEGLGAKTLGKIERGERAVRPMELRAIAQACGLPYEFFTADFNELRQPPQMRDVEARLTRLEDLLTERELQDLEADAAQPRWRPGDTGESAAPGQ